VNLGYPRAEAARLQHCAPYYVAVPPLPTIVPVKVAL
jgi:hypothetical protein